MIEPYVENRPGAGRFALVADGHAAPIVVSAADHPGVVRVAGDLQADIELVSGVRPDIVQDRAPSSAEVVVVGTIGRSPLIDELVAAGRLDVRDVEGRWETSLLTIVDRPWPGVERALVIAGSDERGSIYGAYDLSRQIGVSPWYWWDDVMPEHRDELYVLPGRHSQGTPSVRYRGFFVNDENPNLGTWGPRFFGPGLAPGYPLGFNHRLYERIFELALRLKANLIWPATWGRSFWTDDPENQAAANRYGILIGTSHEAPMMAAIDEWNRGAAGGTDAFGGNGEWSFPRNAAAVEAYWTHSMERYVADGNPGLVTIGMRGNGDSALADDASVDLLSRIVETQRRIIERVTGSPAAATPQVWIAYKEVLRYWRDGFRPPDDVTVVFTDDNWGNTRALPGSVEGATPAEQRAGGYGLYYHFDYVGGGRNYKWVDTISIPNTWQQLRAAYAAGVRELWMFNAGDVKGEEEPLQFALDYAWNPDRWTADNLEAWVERYAGENFGPAAAPAIARVLSAYGHLQSRRKPELLNRRIDVDPDRDLATDPGAVVYDDEATPFSIDNYRELDRVTEEWQALASRAESISAALPASKQDAYYELVLYQVGATANLYAMRRAEFLNRRYAAQRRAATNDLAAEAEARFADDQAMAARYNTEVAGGKWRDWMLQPHVGYGDVARYGPDAAWQQPQFDDIAIPDELFPPVIRIAIPEAAEMGVAIDGSDDWWPGGSSAGRSPILPAFSPYQTAPEQFIDVFNRGATPFACSIEPGEAWVSAEPAAAMVEKEVRAIVQVDWARAPKGTTRVPIAITGAGRTVTVEAVVENPDVPASGLRGFIEAGGYVSIEAANYTRAVNAHGVEWRPIPGIGRTRDGVEPFPPTAPPESPAATSDASPRLEYDMTLFSTGKITVWVYLSPRIDPFGRGGLRYAVSMDDEPPQLVNTASATGADDGTMNRQWERNTSDNVNVTATRFRVAEPGVHTLKFWMVDPLVVVQKLVVDTGGLRPSYLGPQESRRA